MESLALMPKYEAYKESGVDWLGEVPDCWDLVPIRGLLNFRNEKNDPIVTEDVLSLSIANGVTQYSDEGRGGNKRKDDLTAYKIARPNDIVMNSMNVIVGAVGVSKYFGAISPVYYALYAKDDSVLISFYERIFQNEGFQRGLLRLGKGILIKFGDSGKMNTIRMKISQNDLKVLMFPKPDSKTQLLISNFLDQKTAQIDEAIAIKEQQISLLKERKQIIIQQAVTQGLDPNVPMKDSGVDWIGKVPAHWEVKKMKFIFDSIQTGTTPVTSEPKYFDGDVDWYNPKDLNAGYLDKSEKTISELAIKHGQAKIFPGDSVLIVGIGATCGKTAYLKSSSAFNQQITGFSSRHENAEFMYYLISMYSSVMLKVANYTTLPILNNEFFKHFLLPCPSKIEQDRIVGFLRIETLKFEKTIEIQLQQIERLKEYKTTLINSAVTGKIKITPEMVEQ